MAEQTIGKITQVIGAVLDIKFAEGNLPEINEAIRIERGENEKLIVEVAQHVLHFRHDRGSMQSWKRKNTDPAEALSFP